MIAIQANVIVNLDRIAVFSLWGEQIRFYRDTSLSTNYIKFEFSTREDAKLALEKLANFHREGHSLCLL